MIDDKLLWSRNLKHIGTKLDQTPMRIRTFCWKHDNVNLKTKMKLYNSVFLPVITYASGVWFKDIRTKSTYIDKLIVMQRRVIILQENIFSRVCLHFRKHAFVCKRNKLFSRFFVQIWFKSFETWSAFVFRQVPLENLVLV